MVLNRIKIIRLVRFLVPPVGFEPTTFSLKDYCSTIELRGSEGSLGGSRTRNLTIKSRLLCQLSYDGKMRIWRD
jgi:hypothetical protein